MPKLAKKYEQGFYGYQRPYPARIETRRTPLHTVQTQFHPVRKKKQRKVNKAVSLFSTLLLCTIAAITIPFNFDKVVKPLLGKAAYPEIRTNYHELLKPTTNYLHNDIFNNTRMLSGAVTNKKSMTDIYTTSEMLKLKADLLNLMKAYTTIHPAIYVWDYDSGKYLDINASQTFSAASIIKIPVLIQLFKSIEANQLTIYDEMVLTPYYKADGSGYLKNKPSGSKYTIDELAKVMIQHSDNSATNMLMSVIGGMPDVNNGLRSWGIKSTQVKNWLPDMAGTNYTTAKDLAKMLYNLDNPGFLNLNSREYIIDYMSHVANNRLIQAGLPADALFVHKTGDIGKMLGDAGIVYAPNGRKYIVVILANRPYNSPKGKEFINKASSIIYYSIMAGAH